MSFFIFDCGNIIVIFVFFFFFFKQKTAYEIYQCDWSSDVCSSDLEGYDPQHILYIGAQSFASLFSDFASELDEFAE